MNDADRRVIESPLYQGIDEEIAYLLTTTPWGATPTSVTVKLYAWAGGTYTDVSTTCLSGSASVNGNVITTPVVKALVAGTNYRLEIKFTCTGNVFETFCEIRGQR